jgi:Jacalin-like lectin domain
MNFSQGEYVTAVTVRHNKFIQCLTFTTNKGKTLGPAGGKGWRILGKDKQGEEEEVTAPDGYGLSGFSGACGNYLDALVIHWGPIN